MEKRIELERLGRELSEIKELNLDNCHCPSIAGLNESFTSLESLSLVKVGLTTLKGFPKLQNLQKLELSDNRISGGLNVLTGCPKLTTLNLSGNKIETVAALEPLKELKDLTNLELFNCPITALDDYRENVFALLPSLEFLDGYDVDGKDDEDNDDKFVDGSDLDEEDLDDEEEEVDGEVDEEDEDEESEGDDYTPREAFPLVDEDEDDDDDEDDEDEEEEEEENPRGRKRKLEDTQD